MPRFASHLLPRAGTGAKRDPSGPDRRSRLGPLAALSGWRKLALAVFAATFAGGLIWFLLPLRGEHALAELLREQGYLEIAAPADFYLPGTIHTIELRSDRKIVLHPTCTIGPELLAKITLQSPTLEHNLSQRMAKEFDVSAQMRDLVAATVGGDKVAQLKLSLQRSSILQITDEDLLRVQQEIIKGACQDAIAWNISSGGLVCQTRSALKGDLVYDIVYRDELTAEEKGKLTAEVAAALKLKADQERADRMSGTALIYGVRLMPAGILLNGPNAKPVDCRVERT
jgi:hypothetical protein